MLFLMVNCKLFFPSIENNMHEGVQFGVNTYLKCYSVGYTTEHDSSRSSPRSPALSNYHPGERCWRTLCYILSTHHCCFHLVIKHCHLLVNERCPLCWKAWRMKPCWSIQWVSYRGLMTCLFVLCCPVIANSLLWFMAVKPVRNVLLFLEDSEV